MSDILTVRDRKSLSNTNLRSATSWDNTKRKVIFPYRCWWNSYGCHLQMSWNPEKKIYLKMQTNTVLRV